MTLYILNVAFTDLKQKHKSTARDLASAYQVIPSAVNSLDFKGSIIFGPLTEVTLPTKIRMESLWSVLVSFSKLFLGEAGTCLECLWGLISSSCLEAIFTMSKDMIHVALNSNSYQSLDERDLNTPPVVFEYPLLRHICALRYSNAFDDSSFGTTTLKMRRT